VAPGPGTVSCLSRRIISLTIETKQRSSDHGLGVVVSSGENPRVRLLCGAEVELDGHALRLVPDVVHDAARLNLLSIERWLSRRVYGIIEPDAVSLPRPECDLATAMQRCAENPPLPLADPTPAGGSVLYFD
jgi:hypothetical protein